MALGQFLKRQKGLEEKFTAVTQKLETLRQEVTRKEAALLAARDTMAQRLGDLALSETDQNQEAVKHARKSYERQAEALSDARITVQVLEQAVARIELERLEAVVRESPGRMEEAASGFNLLLGAALEAVAALRDIHGRMYAAQIAFQQYERERAAALTKLGRSEPLVLAVGFGALAGDNVPATHRVGFQVPEVYPNTLDKLVTALIFYEARLSGWEDFKKANPDWAAQQRAADDRTSVGNIGEVGDPGRFFGKVLPGWDARDHV